MKNLIVVLGIIQVFIYSLCVIDITVSLFDYNRDRSPYRKRFLRWDKGTQEPFTKM